jgi:hypothetical protein
MRQDNIILEEIYRNMYTPVKTLNESFNYVGHAEEVLTIATNWIAQGIDQAIADVREKGQPLFAETLTSYSKDADSLTRVAIYLKDGKIDRAKSAIKGLKKDVKALLPSHLLDLSSASEEIVPREEPVEQPPMEQPPVETAEEPDFGDMEDLGEDNTDAL